MTRRVVVIGMGGVTALGSDWQSIRPHLEAGRTAIRHMPDWQRYDGVNTQLAAPSPDRVTADRHPRKKTPTMGAVALMAVDAFGGINTSVIFRRA